MTTDPSYFPESRSARRRAFSLIELLLVVAIMAVLAGMVMPRYGRASDTYRLDMAGRRVAADLGLAQARARQRSANQSIVFTIATHSYQLPGESAAELKSKTYTVNLNDSTYGVAVGTVSFAGTNTLTFNGFGIPDRPGYVTLSVGGAVRKISVGAVSGSITVQ